MSKKKLALIVPSSNTTLESDFVPRIPDEYATFHVARMYTGEPATKATEEHMISVGFPRALEDLETADVDLIMFGCTSAGTIHGMDTDREIRELIQRKTGAIAVTVTEALKAVLDEAGVKRIILFSPYGEELNESVTSFMEGLGYQIVYSKGMAVMENLLIAAVEPEEIVDFAMDALHREGLIIDKGNGKYTLRNADAIVFSCTNLRAWECLDRMSRKIDTYFTCSNKALLEYALKKAGLEELISKRGV